MTRTITVVHGQALIKSEHQLHKKHIKKTCMSLLNDKRRHTSRTIPNDYESWNIAIRHKNMHTRLPGTNHALKHSNIINKYHQVH